MRYMDVVIHATCRGLNQIRRWKFLSLWLGVVVAIMNSLADNASFPHAITMHIDILLPLVADVKICFLNHHLLRSFYITILYDNHPFD